MIDELRWKKFLVLNDGFVCLVDIMGTDDSVVQAARVSYGEGTKQVSDDKGLIRYLMRHRHTTPFEMVELKFLVRCPMDCWRQWIRHRTASVNEYSTRYSEAIDSAQTTAPDQWRVQSTVNKQGSQESLQQWPEGWHWDEIPQENGEIQYNLFTPEGYCVYGSNNPKYQMNPGEFLTFIEEKMLENARLQYERRLEFGVAREQARKDLPLSTYTQAYWKIDLHNLFNFLSLRMDAHAQQEIREYATIIGEQIVAPLFPLCWEAFVDYRLKGMFLSALDIEAIRCYSDRSGDITEKDLKLSENKREREETLSKLKRLGLM